MSRPPGPDEIFGPLFAAVQNARVFPDSKTFADARPLYSPKRILTAWERLKDKPDFDLETFVHDHFELPPERELDCRAPPGLGLREHLERMWEVLLQKAEPPDKCGRGESLLPMPKPYLVPGGRFREAYYWDSYFTMLGLRVSGRHDLMLNLLENFASLIERLGWIPNGNRSYLCTRSQPPVFSLMVELCAETVDDPGLLRTFKSALAREYAFWMRGCESLHRPGKASARVVRLDGGCLNRYWDERVAPRPESYGEDQGLASRAGENAWRELRAACESGWDFSSRWLRDPADLSSICTTRLLPVDLNALLGNLERVLAEISEQAGDTTAAASFRQQLAFRRASLSERFFDQRRRFFADLLLPGMEPSAVVTLAGAWPLFLGLATEQQAADVAARLEREFLGPGGWVTSRIRSGQQWDAPNGWAPLQWVVYSGLKRYGHTGLAREGARRWVRLVNSTFDDTRTLFEKYNVLQAGRSAGGGEYANQPGFGWTNGVLLQLMSEGIQA